MFQSFEKAADPETKRRYAVSVGAAVLLYGALALGMVVAARNAPPELKKEKTQAVVFRSPPPKKDPPLPPPVVPPSLRVKKVALSMTPLPAPPALVEPPKLSDKKLKEADAATDRGVVAGREGGREAGAGTGTGAAPPQPAIAVVPPKKKPEAVNLPEDAEPPEPSDDNVMPEYPEDMREQGIEAQVILKVVITELGAVIDIQVLRGEEPFVSVAREAIKKWAFSPATLEGQPIRVFKIIKIPFRLKG